MPSAATLILASQSPRRRELLAQEGYDFAVMPSQHVEECFVCSRESPAEYVARLAYEKARDVVRRLVAGEAPPRRLAGAEPLRRFVLGCDTVAECQGEVLGKPNDEGQARRMLELLSGREHRVLSGLCLWPVEQHSDRFAAKFPEAVPQGANQETEAAAGLPRVRVDATTLRMDTLGGRELSEYLQSYQWEGKAGAFGYQDRSGWLHIVSGSESNVVGLPVELLARMLAEA